MAGQRVVRIGLRLSIFMFVLLYVCGCSSQTPTPAVEASGRQWASATHRPPTRTPTPRRTIPPAGANSTYTTYVTSTELNMRECGSVNCAVVDVCHYRDALTVLGSEGEWLHIRTSVSGSTLTGWVNARYTSREQPSLEVAQVSPGTVDIPTLTAAALATHDVPVPLTATQPPDIPAVLDFTLPPNYGSASLTAGFVPDPYSVGMTSGGSVNVAYLGNGCAGYATRSPDFSLSYTAGSASLLRFYFVGSGDTTMIINAPNGNYVCMDDSFGTLNPTIDFNSPSTGRYDIWIGSFAANSNINGTLFVTEVTGNHP